MAHVTPQSVGLMLAKLHAAFPSAARRGEVERTVDVYYNGLSDLPLDAVQWAASIAIKDDSFCPKVARLRQLAQRYREHQHRNAPQQFGDAHPYYCRGCSEMATVQTRYRPVLDTRDHRRITDTNGRIQLEPFQRLFCACSAPTNWPPDDAEPDRGGDLWYTPPRLREKAEASTG